MARKSGTGMGTAKPTSSRRKATTSRKSAATARRGTKAEARESSDGQKTKTAAVARPRKPTSDQRGKSANSRTATASKRSSSSSNKGELSPSKLKAVLASPIVLNAIAAGLASAAAALMYKKLDDGDGSDARRRTTLTKTDEFDTAPTKSSRVKKAGQRAVAAADVASRTAKTTVAKAATKAVTKAAQKAVVKTAKAAVAKGAKAAVTKARRVTQAAVARGETALLNNDARRRKTRSDAGMKRKSRDTGAASGSPEFGSADLRDAETRALALSATASTSEDDRSQIQIAEEALTLKETGKRA